MQLSDVSVRRPVFAAVLSILLTIVGVVAFLSLSVREYPDTDPPVVSVETVYTGAAASVVEARITQPIEEALSGIEGIQTITSRSRDGSSDISIEFRPGRDIDSAANDVRDRVSGARGDLPEDALPPEVRKVDADTSDYYVVGYYSTNPDILKRRRSVDIRLKRPGLTVNFRKEYVIRPAASTSRARRFLRRCARRMPAPARSTRAPTDTCLVPEKHPPTNARRS